VPAHAAANSDDNFVDHFGNSCQWYYSLKQTFPIVCSIPEVCENNPAKDPRTPARLRIRLKREPYTLKEPYISPKETYQHMRGAGARGVSAHVPVDSRMLPPDLGPLRLSHLVSFTCRCLGSEGREWPCVRCFILNPNKP
jgi:hypothetical protein